MSTRTHRTRLARRVAADTTLSYQQALELVTRLSASGALPRKLDAAGVEASVRIVRAHLAAAGAAGLDVNLASEVGGLAEPGAAAQAALGLLATAYSWRADELHLDRDPAAGITAWARVDGAMQPLPLSTDVAVSSVFDAVASLLAEHASTTAGGTGYAESSGALPLPQGEVIPYRSACAEVNGRDVLVVRFITDRVLTMGELGMGHRALGLVRQQLSRPGLVIVSGPTGSGKSTTARTFAGAVHPEITAMNLASSELRDIATIEAAVSAAENGALVIATMHGRGAPEIALRLVNTVDADLAGRLADQLRLITSQHLVPRNCPKGLAGHAPAPQYCACRDTGTLGRIGLFDVLVCDGAPLDVLAARTAQVSFADSGRELLEREVVSAETLQRYL